MQSGDSGSLALCRLYEVVKYYVSPEDCSIQFILLRGN